MEFNVKLILLALAPVFVLCIIAEAFYLQGQNQRYPRAYYSWTDFLSNSTLALMHEFGEYLAAFALLPLYYFLHQFRLFDIPTSLGSFLALLLLQDFCYYWFHRASHRIRWMWASHVTHHSSERLNLSTAFRQSITYPISGMWIFWLPLILLGFEPEAVIASVAVSLAYQFFVHTQVIDRLGPLEWVLNTPSHHRVHHARNREYIDKNYAGILIIWDRLFGSFVAEDRHNPCDYGITHPVISHNPITLSFHEWLAMGRDFFNTTQPLSVRIKMLFSPPGWKPSKP